VVGIFFAVHKIEKPLFIHDGKITGVMPSVGKCICRFFFLIIISQHDGRAPGHHFPDFTGGQFLVVTVHYFHFNHGMGLTDGAGPVEAPG